VPIDPSVASSRRTLVMRFSPLRKPPTLPVVLPDWVESTPGPYIRPAHMAPPSGPSLYHAPEVALAV
jgi:hypothetical protein